MEYDLCIVGLGYIGLPTACLFAKNRYRVIGFDTDSEKVEAINKGDINTTEPGLSRAIKQLVKSGNLKASTRITSTDIYIVCVPTPILSNKKPDLTYVDAAIEKIIQVVKTGDVVAIESTIPPGTTKKIAKHIEERTGLQPGKDVFVAHCPERVLPGNILNELKTNHRTIGGATDACTITAAHLYESTTEHSIFKTDCLTAELSKLVENYSRLVGVVLANEIASICKHYGADAEAVIDLANRHPRVNILNPGIGAGGHCIPVDPWFLFDGEFEPDILKTALWANELQPHKIYKAILDHIKPNEKVAVLGLAYKPNSDDTRNSPAMKIVEKLDGRCSVSTYDPITKAVDDIEESLMYASLVVVLVAHDCIKSIDSAMAIRFVSSPVVMDCVNALNRSEWESNGFTFIDV